MKEVNVMSRYRKVVTGEAELPDIEGTKFLIYPTMETRMELLELVKSMQTVDEIDRKDDDGNVIETRRARGVNFRIKDVADVCAKIIFEGCWEHNEKGKRLKMKEGEETTTHDDILALVIDCQVLNILSEICIAVGVFDKDAVKKYKLQEKNQKKEEGETEESLVIKPESPVS